MNTSALVLRLVHTVCGVYWAGTLFFVATLLQPSVADAGPEGGKVMQALMRRRYLDIMPIVAVLTMLSGLELLRRISGGFGAAWFGTGPGVTLTVGAAAAIVAFTIGMTILRPSAKRVGPLAQKAQHLPEGPERQALLAEVKGLRRRMAIGGRWVAVFLFIAVIGMAAFRYV